MDAFAHAVLDLVDQIPRGRVTTYGAIATALGSRAPRQVGQVLARWGDEVPWHRVIRSSGEIPAHLWAQQAPLLIAEGIHLANGRVDLHSYGWSPENVAAP